MSKQHTAQPLIGVAACVLAQRHDFHAAADPYVRAIALCGGNLQLAARRLGIGTSTIYRKREAWAREA